MWLPRVMRQHALSYCTLVPLIDTHYRITDSVCVLRLRQGQCLCLSSATVLKGTARQNPWCGDECWCGNVTYGMGRDSIQMAWLLARLWWGETDVSEVRHLLAYCSSPGDCDVDNGVIVSTGPISTDISGASSWMGKGNENLVCPSPWEFKRSFTCRKILDTTWDLRLLLPIWRKVCCGFLSPLKIHSLGQVIIRDLWVQCQAH
jgi:hypothetical protein